MLILLLCLLLSTTITIAQSDDQTPPVTLQLSANFLPNTFDPVYTHGMYETEYVINLFVGLTDYDPVTMEVVPALATSWETDESGLIWTFHLRDDVPWVRYDPDEETFEQLRMVTAADVVYSMQRACTDTFDSFFIEEVFGPLVTGCLDALQSGNGDDLQVSAPDDTTVVFTLNYPHTTLLPMLPMWTIRIVPQDAISEHQSDWTSPGNIVTAGPFALAVHDNAELLLVTNPYFPQDMRGPGNIEQISVFVSDGSFWLFESGIVARTVLPDEYVDDYLNDPYYQNLVHDGTNWGIYYIGITADKAPLDDVRVRRAFSAALNREAFLEAFIGGYGMAMNHFAPSGLPNTITSNDNDFAVGYDPDFAREQLTAAGYPDCEGLPPVEIAFFSSAMGWGEFIAASIADELGCDPDLFIIRDVIFFDMLAILESDAPAELRPHIWLTAWFPDYADAHTYFGELSCDENNLSRECTSIDNLIDKAQRITDSELRQLLYADIEDYFFGYEGEFPLIPLYTETYHFMVQEWYDGPHETDGMINGSHFDHYTLDNEFCRISAHFGAAPLYRAPNPLAEMNSSLREDQEMQGIGRYTDDDGYDWWQLEDGTWVFSGDVLARGFCEQLPVITVPNA